MYNVKRRNLLVGLSVIIFLLLGVLGIVIFLVSQQTPPDSGVSQEARNDGKCVIGWANSHQLITSTNPSGYLPYQTVDAAKPAGATMKVFDLNGAGASALSTTNLGDVDILFITDQGDNNLRTNYVTPTAAQLAIIKGEFNSGLRIVTTSDNGGSAPNPNVSYAAMMSLPVVNNLAVGINYRDLSTITDQLTGTTSSTTSFLNGLTYDTRGTGFRTPGLVSVSGSATCAALINIPASRGGGTTCLLSYAPASGTNGFLLVDANAGLLTKQILASGALWEEIPDCAPEPPAQCGNGTVETGEVCDNGTNNGMACTAPYGGTCTYCTNECQNATIPGAFCGDGIRNGTEECDGQDVEDGAQCTATCTLTDPLLTQKSSTVQSINSEEAVVQYTITVTNPNAIEIVGRVVDQLPSFVQAGDVTSISNNGVFDTTARTITWESLTIAANGNITLTYNLRVRAANYGTFTNTAITYDSGGNEDSRDTETVTLDADTTVIVNKSHTQQTVSGATAVQYTVSVQNVSTVQLVNATIRDTLPANVQSSWVSAISNSGTMSGNVITWSGVTLDPQQTVTRTYTVTYPAGTTGTFTNTVVVTNSQNEELGRDTDTITLTVAATPNTPNPALPDTALFENSSDLVIVGLVLIILGGVAYKLGFGEQLGRSILSFTGSRAGDVFDDVLNPNGFESKAEKSLSRKIARRNKK